VGGDGVSHSGVVQTAWAMLGLLIADCDDRLAIQRGRDFLMRRQVLLKICMVDCGRNIRFKSGVFCAAAATAAIRMFAAIIIPNDGLIAVILVPSFPIAS
jgi:hypothetical protein